MDREVPFRFEVTNSASQLLSEYSDLPEGDGSGVTASVAGRLMLRRDQGKIVFGVLQDSTAVSYTHLTLPTTPYV